MCMSGRWTNGERASKSAHAMEADMSTALSACCKSMGDRTSSTLDTKLSQSSWRRFVISSFSGSSTRMLHSCRVWCILRRVGTSACDFVEMYTSDRSVTLRVLYQKRHEMTAHVTHHSRTSVSLSPPPAVKIMLHTASPTPALFPLFPHAPHAPHKDHTHILYPIACRTSSKLTVFPCAPPPPSCSLTIAIPLTSCSSLLPFSQEAVVLCVCVCVCSAAARERVL